MFYVSGRDKEALEGTGFVDVLRLDQFGLDKTDRHQMAMYLQVNSEKVLILLDGGDTGGEIWGRRDGIKKI